MAARFTSSDTLDQVYSVTKIIKQMYKITLTVDG